MEIGARFGALIVLAEGDRSNGYVRMLVSCDCGTERMIRRNNLMAGKARSCGCVRKVSAPRLSDPVKRDLVGQVFGRLTVIKDSGQRNAQRRLMWLCRCECGSDKLASTTNLVRGITSSCGCLQVEQARARVYVDLTGRRFGALVAISPSDERDNANYVRWNVRCDCGMVKTVRSNSLTQGEIISCGCAVQTGARREQSIIDKAIVREARRRALKIAAGGSFTAADVQRIYKSQRGKCAGPGCGIKLGKKFHRDHKVALSRGGSNDASNIELLCGSCNLAKGAKDPIRWANENGCLI